ncbi:uncharacterized protein K460DRAFT_400958 [Cucurbitaria berberidis CBS 394.84]|uniref:Subtelomeric hrmA-associated cluster protein AFUB-079030/YDR124W-like helical bundle domain-containing protein n=1 Tax=Cucurbitaria berberidis CBS 394.84 TaxID=1168544 RepID=A0A9P4LEA9_9PLEO|nr:uncharacterized protein K460DRAFT_400958 [Cucurbitaria berberidis CBS 394.84]KAF1850924.1 hypothetical protein K460DRAFT_400958 [Cucurbitaria berberidis CBS 394.84]
MAKFQLVNTSASQRDRLSMQSSDKAAAKLGVFGTDPWIMVDTRESGPKLGKSSSTVTATVAQDEAEDDIALPIPIAATVPLGKIVTADGRELPYYHEIPGFVYEPLPGFEHCFKARKPAQKTRNSHHSPNTPQASPRPQQTQQPSKTASPSVSNSLLSGVAASKQHAAYTRRVNKSLRTQVPGPRKPQTVHGSSVAPKSPRQKTLKRSRSVARGLSQHRPTQVSSEDEEDDDNDDKDVIVLTEKSFSFYIGDIEEMKKFLRRRFDELTTRPLRTIVTAWIKQLEPRRLGGYGPYHKQLPSEQPSECTPPWWPQDVPYNEPSHLSKGHLQTLAVDVMLQHRDIDEVKRKGSWVAKLRQAAQCAVELTTAELFSSSKSMSFSEAMKERALNFILPSLFDVAQSYEDHLAQYNLYEGAGNTDPGDGRQLTWHPASRPPRQTFQRKRIRTARPLPAPIVDCDASADETEVDDTISNSFLRQEQARARKQARGLRELRTIATSQQQVLAVPTRTATTDASTPAMPPQDNRPKSSMPTPNTSFHQSMDSLRLGEAMDTDIDVKGGEVPPPYDQSLLRTIYSLNQPMQYSSSHAGYMNQVFQTEDDINSFSDAVQSSFDPGSAPCYANPFPAFPTPYSSQAGNSAFGASMASNNAGFPYEYDGVFPPTPVVALGTASFHGLPDEFKVVDQGR